MVSIEKDPHTSTWNVHYRRSNDGKDFNDEEQVVTARYVILGGGSVGSTKILLQSKEHGLEISEKIGSRFTGNGDSAGFSYHGDDVVNSFGMDTGKYKSIKESSPGPCMTAMIDLRSLPGVHYTEGIAVADGSPPGITSKLVETMMFFASKTLGIRTFPLANTFEKFVEVSLAYQIVYF